MKVITNDSRLKTAVVWANAYFASPDFEKDILSVSKFDFCNVSPEELVKLFRAYDLARSGTGNHVEVKCTYFGWFHRRVLGRTIGDGYCYVNSYGLDRQIWSVGATVVHEVCHVVDEYFPKAEFGHGSNSSGGKENSFPYFIDEKAETWIKAQVLLKESKKLAIKSVLLRELLA